MKHTILGVAGTVATFSLEKINLIAGIAAGVLTAAWMARQLWLSFKKNPPAA